MVFTFPCSGQTKPRYKASQRNLDFCVIHALATWIPLSLWNFRWFKVFTTKRSLLRPPAGQCSHVITRLEFIPLGLSRPLERPITLGSKSRITLSCRQKALVTSCDNQCPCTHTWKSQISVIITFSYHQNYSQNPLQVI